MNEKTDNVSVSRELLTRLSTYLHDQRHDGPKESCKLCAIGDAIAGLDQALAQPSQPAEQQAGEVGNPTQRMKDAFDHAPGPATGWYAMKVMLQAAQEDL